ncbi:glycosyltransferase family 2 protein [Oscillatoria sp. FACHB-1406]|uniref:glycosyltransferase family 2 protein n=1 Tax=Oscillatoria sp. FACHB-1406 TaxID=2692846 RepID=UPI001688A17E|nr:glycosyltransferase family 2 protein [Oscillatoria sp. FACHB-1406]MBD2579005.1 glycosyltransferase [Oscillatoria sp. FACHB-1406]
MPTLHSALTLENLPAPPPQKTGWPWTKQSDSIVMKGGDLPRITIVTPSYNQGAFIEETIRSILLQNYPNLEYIIIDGGSTDNTLEIIQKYEPFIAYWSSEPDRGQSEAVNKGFRRATGQLIGWQNSDDIYQPGAFWAAVQKFKACPQADVIYGNLNFIDEASQFISSYPIGEANVENMIPYPAVCNQAAFFRDRVFKENQYLDESLKHCMDQEFFLRLLIKDYKFAFEPELLAGFRRHQAAKTSQQAAIWSEESFALYRSIYQNREISDRLRDRAKDCLIGICREDYRNSRMEAFRDKVKNFNKIVGWQALNLELSLKYMLSFLKENKTAKIEPNSSSF